MDINRYVEIIRQQQKPVRFLLSRILMKSGLSARFRIERKNYSVMFHPTAYSAAMWIDPELHLEEEAFLASCVKPGDTVIDIGANVGTISLACAASVAPSGRVLAVEPGPEIFESLKRNLSINTHGSIIEPMNIGLGEKEGTAILSNLNDDSQNFLMHRAGGAGPKIEVRTLDSIAPAGPIALVKVDTEGYEPRVILGGVATMNRTQVLYIECIGRLLERIGWTVAGLHGLLVDHGFELYYRAENELLPVVPGVSGSSNIVGLRDPDGFESSTGIHVVRATGRKDRNPGPVPGSHLSRKRTGTGMQERAT